MKIGAAFPLELAGDSEVARRFVTEIERMGFDHLMAYDHVVGGPHDREPILKGPYTEKDKFLDPFVLFSFAAALTSKLEFVTGILILPQRQTVLVAKQAADLDRLSEGRLRLGVAPGWNYIEYDALGIDFHTRGKRLNEQLGYLRRLWETDVLTFDGEFDHIDRAGINPRPTRRIPLWAGGGSEPAYRRALIVDGFILSGHQSLCASNWARIQDIRREAGLSNEDFGCEAHLNRATDAQDAADQAKAWRDVGGTHVTFESFHKGFTTVDQHLDYLNEAREIYVR